MFAAFSWRMRKNAMISTSGFKKEPRFGFSVPEALYMSDFSPKNAILGKKIDVFPPRRRRIDLIFASGSKRELRFGFGFGMPENQYKSDFSPKNAILSPFLPFFNCACAETP